MHFLPVKIPSFLHFLKKFIRKQPYKTQKAFSIFYCLEEIMRFAKISKSICVLAGCILIGNTTAFADTVNYSEIISPGSSFDMSDLNSDASDYSWAVSGNTSSGTIIGPDGTLLIGSDEEAETITVAATSLQDAGATNQYYIKIDPSVSKVSSTHASTVKETAHVAKQTGSKKEKKDEIDFSGMNQVISSYEALDTTACKESDIKVMDSYVDMAKQLKSFEDVSQDQIDACTSRLNHTYSILEQEAFEALPFYERYMMQLITCTATGVSAVILIFVLMKIFRKTKMERDPEYAARIRVQAEQKAANRQAKNNKSKGHKKNAPDSGMVYKDVPSDYSGYLNPAPQQMYQQRPQSQMYQTQQTQQMMCQQPQQMYRQPQRAYQKPQQMYRQQPGTMPQQWNNLEGQQWNDPAGTSYQGVDNGDEATTLLDDKGEDTSLLTSGKTGVLISQKTNEKYYITMPKTIIGKERKRVDICVANDPTISRQHCSIVMQNGAFYLTDLESSNGTYIGGKKLVPNQMVTLHDGDRFTISDQTFIFHINEG